MSDPESTPEQSPRERIAMAVQASVAGDDNIDGAVLVGWVCIAEFMDGKGEKWLSTVAGDARGLHPPAWQVQGYLHNILHEGPGWDPPADPDDDD